MEHNTHRERALLCGAVHSGKVKVQGAHQDCVESGEEVGTDDSGNSLDWANIEFPLRGDYAQLALPSPEPHLFLFPTDTPTFPHQSLLSQNLLRRLLWCKRGTKVQLVLEKKLQFSTHPHLDITTEPSPPARPSLQLSPTHFQPSKMPAGTQPHPLFCCRPAPPLSLLTDLDLCPLPLPLCHVLLPALPLQLDLVEVCLVTAVQGRACGEGRELGELLRTHIHTHIMHLHR